jgi:hypothetical protein
MQNAEGVPAGKTYADRAMVARFQRAANAEGVAANSRWLSAPRDTTGVMTSWPRHPSRGAGKLNADGPVAARFALTTGYLPARFQRAGTGKSNADRTTGYVPARFQRAEDLNNG